MTFLEEGQGNNLKYFENLLFLSIKVFFQICCYLRVYILQLVGVTG